MGKLWLLIRNRAVCQQSPRKDKDRPLPPMASPGMEVTQRGVGTLMKQLLYAGPYTEHFKKIQKKRKMQPLCLIVYIINDESIVFPI